MTFIVWAIGVGCMVSVVSIISHLTKDKDVAGWTAGIATTAIILWTVWLIA